MRNQISKLLVDDPTADDYSFKKTYADIKRGANRFKYSDKINGKAIAVLEEFLGFCQQKEHQSDCVLSTVCRQRFTAGLLKAASMIT